MESVGSIIMYWVVAIAIILFSVLTVTTRKILRSATYLLFTLFATAAVYFLMDYQFLGAVQIAVYAGGIVVLVVFSILLTSKPGDKAEKLASKKRALGLLAAFAMLCVSGYALLSRCGFFAKMPEMEEVGMKRIGAELLSSGEGGMLLPFEAISVLLLACIIGGIVVARKR